jgi:uncharacterized membrane protein YfcA
VKFFLGFVAGGFVGYLLGQVIPMEFLLVAGLLLLIGVFLLFILFHIGLRDFQE